MLRSNSLQHEFVEYIPSELVEGKLYISIAFATAAHRCCCGCGREVITPISPTDWKLTFDGETVSLKPSIGNWSFQCQSHYWIVRDAVRWAERWTRKEIDVGRTQDVLQKEQRYGSQDRTEELPTAGYDSTVEVLGVWQKIRRWFQR